MWLGREIKEVKEVDVGPEMPRRTAAHSSEATTVTLARKDDETTRRRRSPTTSHEVPRPSSSEHLEQMRGPTSSAARRSLLARPTTLAPATRLASTLPSSSSAPARPPSPAAAANPLRTLLSETALALSHVDELTKADSAWQRRLERALTRLDDRVERDRPRIVLGPARHAANRPGQVSPLKREVTGPSGYLAGASRRFRTPH